MVAVAVVVPTTAFVAVLTSMIRNVNVAFKYVFTLHQHSPQFVQTYNDLLLLLFNFILDEIGKIGCETGDDKTASMAPITTTSMKQLIFIITPMNRTTFAKEMINQIGQTLLLKLSILNTDYILLVYITFAFPCLHSNESHS